MTALTWALSVALVLAAAAFIRTSLQARRDAAAYNRTVKHLSKQLESAATNAQDDSARWQAAGVALREALLFIDAALIVRFGSRGAEALFGAVPDTGVSLVSYTRSEELERFCQDALAGDRTDEPLEWQTDLQESTFRVRAQAFEGGAALALSDVSRLQHLNRARQDFVANISHELRTPLTAIRLLLETLQTRQHPAATRTALQNIRMETETLEQMAQELLDISHIESGRAAVRLVSTELAGMVHGAIERLRPQAERKRIQLRTDVLPQTLILADQEQLQRALGNVLHNAIKFTPKKGMVSIRGATEAERVRIDILDSGPGIPPQDLPRVFERFFRGDPARQGTGTGLGLAIAKHVLQAHGGEIWAENTPGGGAKVSLTLIRADAT